MIIGVPYLPGKAPRRHKPLPAPIPMWPPIRRTGPARPRPPPKPSPPPIPMWPPVKKQKPSCPQNMYSPIYYFWEH